MIRILLSIFSYFIFLSGLSGQSYFSQEYDLGNFAITSINGTVSIDSSIYVAIYGYKDASIIGTLVTRFDSYGNMLDSIFVEKFRPAQKESLIYSGKGYLEMVGTDISNPINDFSKATLDYSLASADISILTHLPDTINFNLLGGLEAKQEIFLYGIKQHIDSISSTSFIYQSNAINENVSEVAEFSRARNLSMSQVNIINDSILVTHTTLQDENISCLFFHDLQGAFLNKFEYGELVSKETNLVSDNSNFYFESEVYPSQGWGSRWKSDRVNKFSFNGDSLAWSSRVPEYSFFDIRSHNILHLNTSNGFIYALGSTGDRDSLTAAERHPFVSKITTDGEFEWVRIFKKIDQNNLSNPASYSAKSELLKTIVVNPDQIVNIGWTFYKKDEGGFDVKLWILSLDQNGCLPSEECNHRILIDGEKKGANDSLFRKGFIWNYDLTKDTIFGGMKYLQHSPLEFKVSEEIVMDGRVCNLIKNNKNLPNLIMFQDFEEIYLWDAKEQEFKLVYDFDAIHNYQSSIFYDCSETWDSEENFKLDGDEDDKYAFPNGINYLYLQKGSYSINSSSFSYPFEILTNKGQLAGGLYFNHSEECEPEQEIGFLRCFSHGESNGDTIVNVTSKHFQDFMDCDKLWYEVVSSVESSTMGEKKLKLFPNPSNGMIKLSSIYKNINVLDIKGKLLQSYDNTDRLNLEMFPPGVYFIRAQDSVARIILH